MKTVEFTYRIIHAILTMLSVWFATASVVSGAELGWNMGYVEERVTKAETKITVHEKTITSHEREIAALKSRIDELEDRLKESAKEAKSTKQPKPKTVVVSSQSRAVTYPTTRSTTRYVQRLAGSRWTYPGRIEDHIREHGIDPSGWSRSELEQIHANIHEGRGTGIVGGSRSVNSAPTYRVTSPQVYWSSGPSYGSSCPGGVCPTYR